MVWVRASAVGDPLTVHGREAVAVDTELVRALSAFDEALAATAKAFGHDSARGESANRLRRALFPNGVGQVCMLRYVEKAGQVSFLLGRLATEPEQVRAVAELGLVELVERLNEISSRYREVVQVTKPTFAQVREARRAAQEELSRVTVKLFSRRVDDDLTPEELEALDEALGEILGHQEALRRHHRRRPRGDEDELELGFDDEDDASEDGPLPEDETAEETEPGDTALPPIAQPLDPPAADHDGADAGAA